MIVIPSLAGFYTIQQVGMDRGHVSQEMKKGYRKLYGSRDDIRCTAWDKNNNCW